MPIVVAFPMETTCLVGSWLHLRCFARLLSFLMLIFVSVAGNAFGASEPLEPSDHQIIINLPEFKLRYYIGGKLSFEGSIAVGSTVSQTQLGDYYVANKVKYPTWHPPDGRPPVPPGPTNPLGPRWMGLDRNGYGIHGTIKPSSIGHAVSLGCIRMNNDDVIKLYDMVPVGTKVKLQYDRISLSKGLEPEQSWIKLFPDIYYKEGTTYDNVPKQEIEQRLVQAGFGNILKAIDKELFWSLISVSNGNKVYFPFAFNLSLNGTKLDSLGIIYKGEVLVPLAKIAKELNHVVGFDKSSNTTFVDGHPVKAVRLLGGRSYVGLETLEPLLEVIPKWTVKNKAMSLQSGSVSGASAGNTYSIRISGKDTGLTGIRGPSGIIVPVRPICDVLGIRIKWDRQRPAIWLHDRPEAATSAFVVIQGKAYLSVSEFERFLGIAIGVDEIDRVIEITPEIKLVM